jgi:hypothetical protein
MSKISLIVFNCILQADTSVILEGIETGALLDTGSTVSTISESYYQQHLACSIQLKTIKEILDIECAGGSQLPYCGYIENRLLEI